MPWNENLLIDQERAASHTGSHSRLLAGPGTGKTRVITRRMLYLIQEEAIEPEEILALTFTRAATQELKQRVARRLDSDRMPRVSTLHSFALRQILLNSGKLATLPQPLRIADDWEERYIVQEDLKRVLGFARIEEIDELFRQLSADWQTLAAEENDFTPDPQFIGAWREHRTIFGYTLRSELVYQLKRALEQVGDFQLESPIRHLLVDEYQDLNRCDLAIIRAMVERGSELFVAGDDDQSIYGFRKAHPDGIRHFPNHYPGATDLPVEICMRCDVDILRLAEFVARLDPRRIDKGTRPADGRDSGEVTLLRFRDQSQEAAAIAYLCKCLIERDRYSPSDILILSRVNTNSAFSRTLETQFDKLGVPFVCDVSTHTPLDEDLGRLVLSILRLLRNRSDHLAWRTVLQLRPNNIGEKKIGRVLHLAREIGQSFSNILTRIQADVSILQSYGKQIAAEVTNVSEFVDGLGSDFDVEDLRQDDAKALVDRILDWIADDSALYQQVRSYIVKQTNESEYSNLNSFLQLLETSGNEIEQELDPDSVNMLTMHKAKGLTSKAVIVVAAEDEYIPGRQDTEPELGDERRLLFVSISRAKHKLFITYCDRRTGHQRMLGRTAGVARRSLTRFLRDASVRPVDGPRYIRGRC